ncbi:diaminopimelate decarboxylase [Pseudomonas syringae pv. spinaceae]|uniref:Diaminopimelate decarboxylase n=1 Tax=Pseudomonas syringae pv. spinaceae TaxID=264459 RepID=A0A0P9ZM27_PSESX|nr:diaminopimelate decarboxylase [Pseudomonas syringae pv. spinaceae]
MRQREVRRRDALMPGDAVFDQRGQRLLVTTRQGVDGRSLIHLAAEGPVQLQLAIEHLTVEAQPVAQRAVFAQRYTDTVGAWHEQRALLLIEGAVELAQVIERDTRLGQRGQWLRKRRVSHMTQYAVTNAFVRHGTQLFFDAAQARTRRNVRGKADREQAAEPADCAAEVSVVKQVFAAMPFQLHQHRRLLAPLAQHLRQRGQQQVVDLRAIGGRRDFQQFVGQVLAQP